MTSKIYIITHIPETECLAQLAEEAAELAQAALKLRRALDGQNSPTPMSIEDAQAKLIEEFGDVLACAACTRLSQHKAAVQCIAEIKLDRWAERLKAEDGEADLCEKTT